MTIEEIKAKIKAGQFSITDHALIESFKDGITISDMLYSVDHGKIIENYPHRKRCLIYGRSGRKAPIHVVVDYTWEEEIDIVTVYRPDPHEWINFRIRKKKGPKREKK